MRVLIATPLYPPDIAEPAPYVKELASRLASTDTVTIVAYGRLPEAIPNVTIIPINKQRPLLLRLFAYTHALWLAAGKADVIYAQNGASVELPVFLVSLVSKTPLILNIADKSAHARAEKNPRLGMIEKGARFHAKAILENIVPPKPEILPFKPHPTEQLRAWDTIWAEHVRALRNVFTGASEIPS